MEIVKDSLAEAHEAAVRIILEDGPEQRIETELGKFMLTWELSEPLLIIIKHPNQEPLASKALGFGPGFIAQYKKDILTIKKDRSAGKDFEYTYADRLFDYPLLVGDNSPQSYHYSGNGTGDGIDQIQRVIDKLCDSPQTRRALAITWVPLLDSSSVEPPCLQFVHFMLRNGVAADQEDTKSLYLSLLAVFRSHDILSGWGANTLALLGLQGYIADKLTQRLNEFIYVGKLATLSSSAHIYCEAQSSDLREFKKVLRIS
jgi:thymidylate synthase